MTKSAGAKTIQYLTVLAFVALFLTPAFAETRIALVIGNSSYSHVPKLDNPANDAKLMARTLKSVGFELVGGGPQLNLDKEHFDESSRNSAGGRGALTLRCSIMPAMACKRTAQTISCLWTQIQSAKPTCNFKCSTPLSCCKSLKSSARN